MNISTKYRVTIVYVPGAIRLATTYDGYITKLNPETYNWDVVFSTTSDFKIPLLFTLWRTMKKVKKIEKLGKEFKEM